jgi:hypothetical protein
MIPWRFWIRTTFLLLFGCRNKICGRKEERRREKNFPFLCVTIRDKESLEREKEREEGDGHPYLNGAIKP